MSMEIVQFTIAAAAAWLASIGCDEEERAEQYCWRGISLIMLVLALAAGFFPEAFPQAV